MPYAPVSGDGTDAAQIEKWSEELFRSALKSVGTLVKGVRRRMKKKKEDEEEAGKGAKMD